MESTELRTFLLVAETGSFSRVAVRLGVPQPTLSRHIAKLEEELKGRLLYRHGRGVSLTDAGVRLRDTVQPLIRSLDEVRNSIAAQSGEPSGFLRFAVTPVTGQSLAASVVMAFRERCPQVHLHVVEAFGGILAEWLKTGWVDVAMLYQDVRSTETDAVTLLKEDQFLISQPDFWPTSDPVPLSEIDQRRLVLSGRGAGRRAIEAAFEAAGVPLNVALVVDSSATIKRMVEHNALLSILPFGAVYREVKDGRLVATNLAAPADVSMLLVSRTPSTHPQTAASRALVEILQEQVTKLVAEGRLRASTVVA
jgi:LysR family nitrogen assimilation transcriptional regulator